MENRWGTRVTIDAEGFRSNGRLPAGFPETGSGTAKAPILTVGDSFTFGDQVDDDETWPAYLEAILGRPVLNGGVFGYSLGQSVLRAEEILARMPADYLIVSVFPDDISRCEYSTRYAPKPYFDIVDGRLVLHAPGDRGPRSPDYERQRRLKNLLGHSALLDAVFTATAKVWWYKEERSTRIHPQGEGLKIARLLVERIDSLCRERGCRPLMVSQGPSLSGAAAEVLEHADRHGIPTLDLIGRVNELGADDPGIFERFFDGHMTPEGNRWVAEEIAAILQRLEPGQTAPSTGEGAVGGEPAAGTAGRN
jgi:GNAT superfamily N-acetyltransferase